MGAQLACPRRHRSRAAARKRRGGGGPSGRSTKAGGPGSGRVGLLWDATRGSAELIAAKAAAQGFAIDLQVMEVRAADDLDAVLRAGVSAGSSAIVLLSSPIISRNSRLIADF